MTSRRASERQRTYMGARIEQPLPFGSVDCLVRNLGAGGAQLDLHNTAIVADRFSLVIPRRAQRVAARVVWRKFDAIGVAFEAGEETILSGSVATEDRLRTSEARRLALEARLAQLNEHA